LNINDLFLVKLLIDHEHLDSIDDGEGKEKTEEIFSLRITSDCLEGNFKKRPSLILDLKHIMTKRNLVNNPAHAFAVHGGDTYRAMGDVIEKLKTRDSDFKSYLNKLGV